MKIAVFGKNGQVATELARRVPDGVDLVVISRDTADFLEPDMVTKVAKDVEADAFINAAAYTAVDRAEEEFEAAHLVNAVSVGKLAEVAAAHRLPLLHVSTDYVFQGTGDARHLPEDETGPTSVYGRTKLEGEKLIRRAAGPHAILRTSWVFSAHGSNFVKSMLRLGQTRDKLNVVDDQVGGPTPAHAIADALFTMTRAMADGRKGGTYHFSGTPDASWADFAREIFAQANLTVDVTGIPTRDYPTPAVRPANSRLDCQSLFADFGISRPDWRAGLTDVLKELHAQ